MYDGQVGAVVVVDIVEEAQLPVHGHLLKRLVGEVVDEERHHQHRRVGIVVTCHHTHTHTHTQLNNLIIRTQLCNRQ